MSKSAYLLTILPGKFADIDEALSRHLKTRSGRALVSISTTRALLTSAVATEIEHCGPGRSLMDSLKGSGIYGARPVMPNEVVSLLNWREPAELAPRPVLAKADLVAGGYDWNVKRTRLVEAWEQGGGAANIHWGEVLVGQIDTGYTEHPCLGWAAGRSPFVRTDLDRNQNWLTLLRTVGSGKGASAAAAASSGIGGTRLSMAIPPSGAPSVPSSAMLRRLTFLHRTTLPASRTASAKALSSVGLLVSSNRTRR